MPALPEKITIGLGIDLQDYYEETRALRDALSAQIESLEAGGKVCRHTLLRHDTETTGPQGRRYAVCDACSRWVTLDGRLTFGKTDR